MPIEPLLEQIKGDLHSMTNVAGDLAEARVQAMLTPLKRKAICVLLGSILAALGLADAVHWLVALATPVEGADLLRDRLGWSALALFVVAAVLFISARWTPGKFRSVNPAAVDRVRRPDMAQMVHTPM